MNNAFSGIGIPATEFLGAGAVYFNWGETTETKVGVTKGGSEFTDNAEYREREADGDYAPVKNHRSLVKLTPTLTINALKINVGNFLKFYAGMVEDSTTVTGSTRLYRTKDLSSSYLTNVAFVGQNREGKNIAVVLQNALGDGAFALPATPKEEEIVPVVQFVAHVDSAFDPDDETTYPYYIEFDTSQVTFTVEQTATPVVGAVVVCNGQAGLSDASGEVVFTVLKGSDIPYTVTASTYVTQTSSVDVTADTTAVAIELVSE